MKTTAIERKKTADFDDFLLTVPENEFDIRPNYLLKTVELLKTAQAVYAFLTRDGSVINGYDLLTISKGINCAKSKTYTAIKYLMSTNQIGISPISIRYIKVPVVEDGKIVDIIEKVVARKPYYKAVIK